MSKKKKKEMKNEQELMDAEEIIMLGMLGATLVLVFIAIKAWFMTPIGIGLVLDAIWNVIRHIREHSRKTDPSIEVVEYIAVTDSLERKQVVERVKASTKLTEKN